MLNGRKKSRFSVEAAFEFFSGLERARTSDTQFRKLLFYPAELRDQIPQWLLWTSETIQNYIFSVVFLRVLAKIPHTEYGHSPNKMVCL